MLNNIYLYIRNVKFIRSMVFINTTAKRHENLYLDSLIVNASYLFGLNIAGAILGMLAWVVTSRLYSPSDVGLASSVISIIQLLSGIASLGMGIGVVRFLANADDPMEMLNSIFAFITITSCFMGIIYLMGIKYWSLTLVDFFKGGGIAVGFMVFLIVTSINSLLQMVFVAFRKAQFSFWQFFIMQIVRLALTVIFVSIGAIGILAAIAIGSILASGVGIFGFCKLVIKEYRYRLQISMRVIKDLIPYSLMNYLGDLLYRVPILITPPLVLEILGAEKSGHAYIGWMIGWLIYSPGQSIASAAFAEGSNSPLEMQSILKKIAFKSFSITTLFATIVVLSAPIILMLFGKSYSVEGSGLLIWLSLAAPLVALNNLYFSWLRVQNEVIELLLLSIITVCIALVIPLIGVRQIGLASSGIGWFISQLVVLVIVSRQFITKGLVKIRQNASKRSK